MMPGETGFELARDLRASSSVPILMLTARDEAREPDRRADHRRRRLRRKPFEPRELSLRIANILRRARPAATPAVESVRFGDFRFHIARGELKRGEEIIRLTDRERDMLRLLAATPGETVPRQALAGNGGAHRRARRRRAGQPPAPQDRARSGQSAAGADRARDRLPAGDDAMTTLDVGIAALRSSLSALRSAGGRFYDLCDRSGTTLQERHAEGPLCPRAADHHRADGGPAIGGRLRVHGAALEPGDAAAVRRGGAGHRGADRRLQGLSAGRRPRAAAPHRAGQARPGGRFPAGQRVAAAGAEAVLLAARPGAVGRAQRGRSAARSGSTPSAARRWSRSASSSTTR